MQPTTRDLSLDVLKGFGCLMMIMAHMPIKIGFYRQLTFFGEFAPVPFYAVVGVTAAFQAQRYKPRPVILNDLFLFLSGFALNGFNSPDFLRPPAIHFDIIQIIAIGSLVVYLLEYYFEPPIWVYLVCAVLSFLIKLGLDIVLPAQNYPWLAGILLTYSGTFPVFPWLFLFFLGVFAYRIGPKWNLGSAVLVVGLYLMLVYSGINLGRLIKFDMSPGYFLWSCSLLFAFFFLARIMEFVQRPSPFNPLVFFGQNSLLFLFVHFAVIHILSSHFQLDQNIRLFKHYPFLFWLLIFMVAWVVMAVLIYAAALIRADPLFDRTWVWVLLTILILTIPLVPFNSVVRWGEVALGVVVGLYYHQVSHLLKQRWVMSPG